MYDINKLNNTIIIVYFYQIHQTLMKGHLYGDHLLSQEATRGLK